MTLSPTLKNWLLEGSDPSVQWRFHREVLGRAPSHPEVQAAQARIGQEGWAAQILLLQREHGQWETQGTSPTELYNPKYTATNWRLLVLAELGATRKLPKVELAGALLLQRYEEDSVFGGLESELCVTGNAVRMLHLLGFGDDPCVARGLAWLVAAQKRDGGWNCFTSEVGTLDAWEALAAFAQVPPARRSPEMQAAVERGAEFYLQRHLLEEGTQPYAPWRRLHYPNHYYYDFLVGLDVLTRLGFGKDARLAPALDLLESKRAPEGWWSMDAAHPDMPPDVGYTPKTPLYPVCLEMPGWPSRWLTVGALAVLKRAGRLDVDESDSVKDPSPTPAR